MAIETTVLVVGAGPTGLLTAAELLRRGVECLIIDAQPAPSTWDRATIVHPRSMEVFESLGVAQEFLERGVKQYFARLHSAGEVLGDIDLSLCGSRYGFNIGISEEVTESILTDYLHRQNGQVVRSSRLIKLEQNDQGVRGTVDSDGVERVIAARWVVGCDGYRSTVRQQCGIDLIGNDLADPWAVFDTTIKSWTQSHEAIYAYLDEIPVILTSLPQSRWRVYLRPSAPESDLLADAAMTLQRYIPSISFADVENPMRFRCHAKVAPRFRSGRVLLAGDAAHVCSPSQGHGMNSGLQDAFNLAWKLAHVCHGHCDQALLDSYEAERRPVAEKNARTGEEFERAQDLTDPVARRERNESIKAGFRDPATRHHESLAEAELDFNYATSPIVMGDSHHSLGAGHRIPHAIPITHHMVKARELHELTHRAGHTALLVGNAATNLGEIGDLALSLTRFTEGPIIDAVIPLAMPDDHHQFAQYLSTDTLDEFGISDTTLIVVRPDGHIGLHAKREHANALEQYVTMLSTGGHTAD